jgi:uncharacterized protein YceH (UPF0502 family)
LAIACRASSWTRDDTEISSEVIWIFSVHFERLDYSLDLTEVRVLGALLEKESTTPEYYPMSLNALLNACNQKSNRHPVVSYDEETVAHAIELLKTKRLAATILGGGRVAKYAQRISETLNLGRRELALLCTLMLRGQQTLGELRDRSDRMHHFEDLSQVETCLQHLNDLGLAMKLPRQPGQKESRFAHLLSGDAQAEDFAEAEGAPSHDRLTILEAEVAELRAQVRALQEKLDSVL